MTRKRQRLGFERLETRSMLSGVTAAAATVAVNIPQDLTGQPGSQIVAPVRIDNAEGVRAAEIHITYDTNLLDADDSSVTAGALWADASTQLVANVDDAAGTIVAWAFRPDGLAAGGGSLFDIHFTIKSTAPVGGSTRLDFTSISLNEGQIVVSPQPQPGQDSTDGVITFVAAPQTTGRISGVVYADTNRSHQPDASEGLAGVRITLVNTGTGQTADALTDATGRYEFRDLAAGSYQIREQQPAAFIDGGQNELAAVLSSGQSLADQNFREIGLRAECIYNRLLTTTALPVGSAGWTSTVQRAMAEAEDDVRSSQNATPQVSQQVLREDPGFTALSIPNDADVRSSSIRQDEATPATNVSTQGQPLAPASARTSVDDGNQPTAVPGSPAPDAFAIGEGAAPSAPRDYATDQLASLAWLADTSNSERKVKSTDPVDFVFNTADPWLGETYDA